MDIIPKYSDYQLFIRFSLNIDNKGYIYSVSNFEYSRILLKNLSTFKKEKILTCVPKKWHPAVSKNTQKTIEYQINVSCYFNNTQMRILFFDKEDNLLFNEVQIQK